MKEDDKINGFVAIIKDNYDMAKNFSIQKPQICAGAIRTALETAVKLFWLKKYDKEPVWVVNGKEEFNLYQAVKDLRFSSLFNEIVISDIHVIRKMCNDVLHGNEPFTVGTAQELLNRLEKVVEAIQTVIDLSVIHKVEKDFTKNFIEENLSSKVAAICSNKENYLQGEKIMINSVKISNPLVRDVHRGYGGKAQAIYDACCEMFDWDISQRYLFGLQQILYAEKATPEGYSPWFLPHNNWTETKGGNWFNKIYGDVIEEMWLTPKYGLYHDETRRVTFVKKKLGEYVFLGIYTPIKVEEKILKENIINKKGQIIKRVGDKVWIKTYQFISDKYAPTKK